LRQLLLSRGPISLCYFIFSRLFRVTHEYVYQKTNKEQQTSLNALAFEAAWKIHKINRFNFEDNQNKALLGSIYHGEIESYVDGIKADSILFAVTKESSVIHTSFVQFRSRYKKLIHESHETPLIGNCWTDTKQRGQGLYPKTINFAADHLLSNGYKKVLISCAVSNIASVKGIEKAKFKIVQELKSYIIFNKVALQISIKDDIKKRKVTLF